jgi:hypothetical protein
MATMNSFNGTQATPADYRPILPVSQAERATDSQQSECCCPEFCQLDHGN